MQSFPRIERRSHKLSGLRALTLALCLSVSVASVVAAPLPHAVLEAKKKAPKFKDNCEVYRQPFSAIKNYQLSKIGEGALIGGLLGVVAVALGDANGNKRSAGDYLAGAAAGAVAGGVVGYIESRSKDARNRAELQAAIAGDFSRDVAQYSDLPEKLALLGNCRLEQIDQVELDTQSGVIDQKEAGKRLESIEKWIEKDDKVIAKASKMQTETITSYAQSVAIVDGLDLATLETEEDALDFYEAESLEYMDSFDIEYAAAQLQADNDQSLASPVIERIGYVNAVSGANMRSGPGTNHSVLGTIKGGTALQILSTDVPDWVEVSDGVTTGFMSSALVSEDEEQYRRNLAEASAPKVDRSRPKAVTVRGNTRKPTGYRAQASYAVARKKSFDETRTATKQATDARLASVRQGLQL